MDAEDQLRALRRTIEEKRRVAMNRLVAAAGKSSDAEVRAAWSEHKTIDEIAAELSRKKNEE